MRVATLSAMLLLAACSFDAPGSGDSSDDGGGGDDDGGGGPVEPPGCPDGDDDGDAACNAADRCQGHDDRLDIDSDGTADGCDDWPCGLKPEDPGELMSDAAGDGRNWGAWPIDIGDDRRVVATPGQQFPVAFRWGLYFQCGQQGSCRGQVEIGYGTTRVGCVYDNTVPDELLFRNDYSGQLTAPTTPGVYEIRLNAGRGTSCGTGMSWYGGDPGDDSTIAILCVR